MPKSDYALKQQKKKLYASSVAAVVKPILAKVGIFDQPDPAKVLILDTHQYTGVIDGFAARAGGIAAVLIKYSDGKRMARFFRENYRAAADAGLLVGSWHWLRSANEGVSPNGQAMLYAGMLKDFPSDFPQPYVDFERLYRDKRRLRLNANSSDLWSFREVFREAYGGELGIYTGHYYWNEMGRPRDLTWLNSSLWMPRYGGPPIPTQPWIKAGEQWWDIHQWTENGEGVRFGVNPYDERAVDLNYWKGSIESLYAYCGKEM